MKKAYAVLIALGFSASVSAQTPRLCLFEEFTSEDCPPCAATNPALNVLLNANPFKIVSIKYQNDIPSAGPMYGHNPTEVDFRMTYYGNTYSPQGIVDGNYYNDQPASLTQATIDTRQAVTSPFEVRVEHVINGNNVDVTLVVKKTGMYSSSSVYYRVAIIERNVYFATAPGTNGELHFEGVFKKMLPSTAGTLVPASMMIGDSMVYSGSWAMANVYDMNQIAVVAFVQDDVNKEVLQAGYSRTQMPNDAALESASLGTSFINCTGSTSPTVVLSNQGIADLTTCTIEYRIDGGALQTYTYNGLLTEYASTTITLPVQTLSSGIHTLTASAVNPNGATDLDVNNNDASGSLFVTFAAVPPPVAEGFTLTTFPPSGWARFNPDGGPTWARSGFGASGNNGSAKMDYYNSTAGSVDELYLPTIDLVGANTADLVFKIAKARYSASYNDLLEFNVSSDCGVTWTTAWAKDDLSGLYTATSTSGTWTPTATTWRTETVSLNSFIGQTLLPVFKATSGFGNSGYIDDINLTINTGVGENEFTKYISIFPIPSSGTLNLDLSALRGEELSLELNDITGKSVYSQQINRSISNQVTLDLSGYADGTYFVVVNADGQQLTKKVVLTK